MAKTKQAKETSLPVIVALVFFIVSTIGLGVFVYVLFSDQEAKDAQVVAAKKEVTDMRASVKEAELIARIYRVACGIQEGAGNESDLVIVQNEVKEGSKPYQELVKMNAAAKKRGVDVANDVAAKFDTAVEQHLRAVAAAGGMPPKFDSSTLLSADEFNIWPGELDANKQLLPPKGNLLEVANRAALVRNFAMKFIGDERSAYQSSVAGNTASKAGYDKGAKAFNDKAIELPKDFNMKIGEMQKLVDKLRDDYRRSEAATRAEITKRDDQIDQLRNEKKLLGDDILALKGTITLLNSKAPKSDPFAYDVAQGKITARQDNTVEINLGSNAHVQTGLTFTVLPIDFPQKGRVSRMKKVRAPDDRGNYKETEVFIPKATIEVIEVLGPDSSRCRITGEYDDVRDRALPGDLLYNSVWRKGQADHVALIGIFDINGDGTDDIANVVRDLTKMGIPVDAYFDLKTKKWVGKLTDRTRYLVNGFSPTPTPNDPNLEAKTQMIGAMKDARDEAISKSVQVVPARDFFGRTGYKAKIDVSDDFINQAAAKYLSGLGDITPPAP